MSDFFSGVRTDATAAFRNVTRSFADRVADNFSGAVDEYSGRAAERLFGDNIAPAGATAQEAIYSQGNPGAQIISPPPPDINSPPNAGANPIQRAISATNRLDIRNRILWGAAIAGLVLVAAVGLKGKK